MSLLYRSALRSSCSAYSFAARSRRAIPAFSSGQGFSYCKSIATSSSPASQVKALDHVVLTCADLEVTKDFYTKFLGMKAETFTSDSDPPGVVRHSLSFGDQKINLHKHKAEFEPKAQHVQPGSADLCFLTDVKIDDVLDKLKADGLTVLEGGKVVNRTGARGALRSVYIRDPDLNLIEISNYV